MDAGATHVVATDEQDLVKEILGLTGGKGIHPLDVEALAQNYPSASSRKRKPARSNTRLNKSAGLADGRQRTPLSWT